MASHLGDSKDSRYDRDSINVVSKDGPEKQTPITHLSRFIAPETPAQAFEKTAEYARNPRTYLESNLGNKALTEKEDLLSIPDKVERDIYGNGEHKKHFEQYIAKLFGKEQGLFFITGVQAQLAAMKIHAGRAGKKTIAWHATCHLESAEEASYKELYSLDRILLGSDPDSLPTVEEIEKVLSLPEQDRPAAILIELPNRELGCQTYSFSHLEAISSACREAGVKFHMDGARIWEIEPYYKQNYGKSFAEIGQLFDSIYVSFYKGLRGAAGAMLLGPDAAFIDEAKKWQRRAGGNAVQLTYEILDCERGYNENIGTFAVKWHKMEDIVDKVTAATAKFKNEGGTPIVQFWSEKATCCQIRTIFQDFTNEELFAARDKVAEKIHIRMFERAFQRPRLEKKEVVTAPPKEEDDDKTTQAELPKTATTEVKPNDTQFMIEWMVMKVTLSLETKTFVDAYVLLCEELLAARKS